MVMELGSTVLAPNFRMDTNVSEHKALALPRLAVPLVDNSSEEVKELPSVEEAWEVYLSKYSSIKKVKQNKRTSFKSYMDFRTITCVNSNQYKLQTKAITNEYGIREYDERMMVALGTAFNAPVGAKVDVLLSSGEVLELVVGDIKQNIHTEKDNMVTINDGSIIEFIVDTRKINEEIKVLGNFNVLFKGYIEEVRILK